MKLKIKTNNQFRHLLFFNELTDNEKRKVESDYDYMKQEEIENQMYVKYKGDIFGLDSFIRIPNNPWAPHAEEIFPAGWSGYCELGYGFGYLIKFSDDGESVLIANYYYERDDNEEKT